MRISTSVIALFSVLLSVAAWPAASSAFYNLQIGDPVTSAQLPLLEGGKGRLWKKSVEASLFVFFKPDQENSLKALEALVRCKSQLEGKKIHLVGIVADTFEKTSVQAALTTAGWELPVIVDQGNALYGSIGAVLTPSLGVVDKEGVLRAYQPFLKINYDTVVKARVLHLLGELDDDGLEKVLEPPAATQGGDLAVAGRNVKLGTMLYKAKKFEKALGLVDKSLELAPELAAAHGLRAAILAGQGKCELARVSLGQAIALKAEGAEDVLAAKASEACPELKLNQ